MTEDPYAKPSSPPPLPPAGGTNPPRLGDDPGMRLLMPVGNSGWAIASGYLGLISVLLVPAPLALLTGILALRDIRASKSAQQRKHGTGRAIFGLIMGGLFSLIGILVLVRVFVR